MGDIIDADNAEWSFRGSASENFDAHVRKSIPLYDQSHQLILAISDFFLGEDSLCYDLGCATGTLCNLLAERHQNKAVRIVGVDVEEDMIKIADSRKQASSAISYVAESLVDMDLEPADLIISHYTMQFIKPKHRQTVFDRVHRSLNWGGGFLLFEKVRGPDARFQDMMTTIYHDHKLDQGFTGDQIIAKLRSLKGVLEPFSTDGNLGLMKRAGFVDVMTVMKYVCFEGFLAIK